MMIHIGNKREADIQLPEVRSLRTNEKLYPPRRLIPGANPMPKDHWEKLLACNPGVRALLDNGDLVVLAPGDEALMPRKLTRYQRSELPIEQAVALVNTCNDLKELIEEWAIDHRRPVVDAAIARIGALEGAAQ